MSPSPAPSEGADDEGIAVSAEPIYRVYVANESSDLVSRVAFQPGKGAWVERDIPVGLMPSDNDGAHGITVSPDGRHWFLTLAHGTPNGFLWTFTTGSDSLVARTELGLFPATMGITPTSDLMFVVNFNLHGDRAAGDVSVVHVPTHTELARIPTCVTPHGSRVNASGSFHYSTCMRSEQLVEISVSDLAVTRRLDLSPSGGGALLPDDRGLAMPMGAMCMPTWAEPGLGAREGFVYVACNRSHEVVEVDTDSWSITRRWSVQGAPYNLDATADGTRLVVTLKGAASVAVLDLERGAEALRVATSKPVTHGVVTSPDGRFAFVSNESVGSVPGSVDVIDLESGGTVATVDVHQQAGGIGFWSVVRP